jgi:hypothetical protein
MCSTGRAIEAVMILNVIDNLRIYLFPPVTRLDALEIAANKMAQADVALICHGRKPSGFHIYNEPAEPCWWIQAPWGDGRSEYEIRSSRLILVGRNTGLVHYDGSANDEG